MGDLLDRFEPILAAMPAVRGPEGHVHFKNKLMWTLAILLLYFALTNINIFGLSAESQDIFGMYRALLAGASGSLLHLGIGPIVTASIVLQLLKGAGILQIDTSDARGQVMYMGLQKLLIFVMIIVEAFPMVASGMMMPDASVAMQFFGGNMLTVSLLIFLQVCIGGLLVVLMDEVVTKWGVGSGVGLFIVAGVSQGLVNGFLNWQTGTDPFPIGFFPRLFAIGTSGANFLEYFGTDLLALITTIAIFMVIVYVESTRIEIPLAHTAVRGARARFPVKLIYASVLPMILVRVLQANIQMIGMFLSNAGITILGTFQGQMPVNGLMWYIAPINQPQDWMWWLSDLGHAPWEIMLRMGIDITVMVVGGAIFALFWVKTAGLDSKDVARQIQRSGMHIPGYRRNEQVLVKYLDRYIPRITVIGGVFIGLLSVVANLFGVIGAVGGTGLLLAVSITYRLYEEVASQQIMEMYPFMRSFFGKE
ncbi:preprotein translocase subunit SecY [Methanoculleus sp. YWC-01]|jgi:preprotein translocase subunit SecY|uniref:Protein translocase subunit SecY n=1 Tax=Methanoculleus nereidis TaxID=2735141 RepID=A0ABU3Z0M1_9EURY|nr:preprotein translocase subunit SecY [Methanoculleus sp. YWC-01]MDV4342350.1 preprotein translocase subunit SecY [Methanoculleus sp. YWC-01]PKL55469.1 MAG: preprotein translocase subunit SecY [Methanomicrobiales archaeon HGW-Methanomicrobiales-6]